MTKQAGLRLAGAFAALALLTVVCMAAVAAHASAVANAQAAAAHRCQQQGTLNADTAQLTQQVNALLAGSADAQVPGLTDPAEQLPNAKVIVATGVQMGIEPHGQVIALATALQESGLRNLDHGDRDSLGLFQQRPSQGWGTREQIMNPVYASRRFYSALTSVDGWQHLPLATAAQKVQKSAKPDAYAHHERLATALQQAIAPALHANSANSVPAAAPCPNTPGNATIPAGALPAGYRMPADAAPAARTAIQWALQQLGTPYQWGGSCANPHGQAPSGRCDCSSLVQRAYGVAGIVISRTTYTQVHDGRPAPTDTRTLRPGDLLFSGGEAARPEHVAMAIGDGLLVQAPRPGRVVEVAEITTSGRVLAVRRLT